MMNKKKKIFGIFLIAALFCFSHQEDFPEPKVFYPVSISESFLIENPFFLFSSQGACTLRIAEASDYYSREDVFNAFPVYEADVSGCSHHYADYIFSEEILYAWYIECTAGEGFEKRTFRSDCGYFKIFAQTDKHGEGLRSYLISQILENTSEYKNAVEEGYSLTGEIKINGLIPTNNELMNLLNSIRVSKRKIARVRVK